jgi:hypothetical protein
MRLEISPIRNNLSSLQLTLNNPQSIVIEQLEKENWIEHKESKVKANAGHDNRSVLPQPQSPVLKDLLAFVSSDAVKRQIIAQLYQDFPHISSLWEGWTQDQMNTHTVWGGQFLKDNPGFYLETHLDTRLQVATGLIYLNDTDDADWSTFYYTDKYKTDKLRISNNFGQGVLHINDHDTWHEGYNRTTKDRYLMIVGLLINV